MDRIEANEEITQRQISGGITSEYWYNLVLRATGDPDMADKAAANFMLAELRAGRTPE